MNVVGEHTLRQLSLISAREAMAERCVGDVVKDLLAEADDETEGCVI